MTSPLSLSASQTKFLRAKAHPLSVVISVGNKGITPSLIDETIVALNAHELIKIKLPAIDKKDKQSLLNDIVEKTSAAKVQLIGRVGIIFRAARPAKLVLPAK